MIKKERRVPTVLGLLIIFLGTGLTAFLVENFQNVATQAHPSIVPQEVKITNLSSSGFTVSWATEEETQGFIRFGETKSLEKIALDERDKGENLGEYFTHHVPVKNLKQELTYYFQIVSQNRSFDQGGLPYKVMTAPAFPYSSSEIEPAYGTILAKDNTPVGGAIVYLTIRGSLLLSTLTKASGNFLIPLNLALRADLKGYLTADQVHEEEILVRAAVREEATAITTTENDSPVPTIILGKSYDFRSQKEESLAKKRLPQKVLGTRKEEWEIEILFPKEGAALLDPKPLFKGKGIPGNEVTVKIESPPLLEKTVVDPNGQWFFRPKKPLSPGKHTITIATKKEKGEKITLSRNFLILKSGVQVLGEATPSATLTPTPTVTPFVPSPTPTFLTPTPSIVPGVFIPTVSLLGLGALLLFIGAGMVFIF